MLVDDLSCRGWADVGMDAYARCQLSHEPPSGDVKKETAFVVPLDNLPYVLDHIHRVNMIYLYVRD